MKYLRKPASLDDADEVIKITDSVYTYESDNVIKLIAIRLDYPEPDIFNLLDNIKYQKGLRATAGFESTKIQVGLNPAHTLRGNACYYPAFMSSNKELENLIFEVAHRATTEYKNFFGVKDFAPNSVWGDTIFNSGVVNQSSPLVYHRDTNNSKSSVTSMIYYRHPQQTGGELILPEYKVAFDIPSNYLVFFKGAETIHGVAPITGDGHRYSIVLYENNEVNKCHNNTQEKANEKNLKEFLTPKFKEYYKDLISVWINNLTQTLD